MSEDTIRVGIIGAGANTRLRHVPGLQTQPGVELAAVANRSRESSTRAAAEHGVSRSADHWRDIIDDTAIDAVCIGTWPYMHAPITIAALEAGKHVLCEARMAMNAHEAHAMLRAARAQPALVAQIVPTPHTLAFDRTIIDLVADGYIGDLVAIHAHITSGSDFPQWDSPLHWRHDRDLSGNNIMTMGIWYEAMLRWVGPAATVHAVGQTVVKHRKDGTGRRVAMSIPDQLDILCRMEQGGQLRMSVSTVLGLAPGTDVHLYGTEGTIRLAEGDGGLGLWSGRRGDNALQPIEIASEKVGDWRVEEEFINAVRGKEAVTHTDLVTAVKYMEWSDAVCMSLRSGETVNLPLFRP
jgi:predicted dehydrogenase